MTATKDQRVRASGGSAVVTGASRGIGAAIAVQLAEDGYDIVGVSTTLTVDSAVGRAVRKRGRKFTAIACDLRDRRAVNGVADRIQALAGVPEVLIHGAGIHRRAPVPQYTDEMWDDVIAVNLTAPFVISRALGARMIERRSGKIVFIASLLSFQGGVNAVGYAASKGGISQMVMALANEWAQYGLNVNAIAPGYTNTDLNEDLLSNLTRMRQIGERIPASRWAQPEEMASVASFLVSDQATYINGVTLPVDGGWLGR